MRKATDQRDAQTISLLWTSLLLFHGGDVTCFDACHVIWCGGHVIWCDVIACVVSCYVMQCDVMWCALMWWALQWSRCVFEVVLWQCGDPKYYSVLQSTTVYYKVLLRYYSVLQSTTPVLLCTAKYYSSTTLYYTVLLQYYSVLQSTTPVLLCTTTYYSNTTLYYKVLLCTAKYYSSTTLYCKVLLQYYSVLQSTAPVLLCAAKYYSSTTLYYKVLLQYYSVLQSTTLYCKVLLQYYSVLQSTTPVLLCTTKYYSSTTLYYTVLQRTTPVLLCTKVLLQYYSVLQSTTPVLLCTTQYYNVLLQYYSVLQSTTPVLLCTTQYYNVLLQYYSVLQSTTLYCKVLLQYYSVLQSTTPVLQSTTPVLLCTTQYYNVLLQYYSVLKYYSSTTLYYKAAFMIDPWHIWTVIYMIAVRRIWNVIYNARSNRSHPPTTPNTAPATQNDCDDWSASHMKRHLQCAEQRESQSNFTKYCACHAKWISWLVRVSHETSFTMRGATGITIQLHQTLRLPRKMNLMIDPRHIWNVIYNARSNQSHPPTSPNTAPATQNESHDWSASHIKHHLECAEQLKATSNLTKYCACHAKWISWLIRVTYETSFTMRGATNNKRQVHQILRLPRKMNLMIDPRHIWNVISNARSKQCHPLTSPNTAPATKSLSSRLHWKLSELLPPIERRFEDNPRIIRPSSEDKIVISHPPLRRPYSSDLGDDFVLKNTTFRAPAISQNVTKCCACHEKSHSNFTKYCACHAKCISWLIRVTYETSFRMRGASKVNLEPQQILRLPRNL